MRAKPRPPHPGNERGGPKRGAQKPSPARAKRDVTSTRGKRNARDTRDTRDTRNDKARDTRQDKSKQHGVREDARKAGRPPKPQHAHAAHGGAHGRPPPTAARVDPALQARLQPAGALLQSKEPPAVGEWLWTMREGAERDLIEELLLGEGLRPRGFLPALCLSKRAPELQNDRLEVTFARQGFLISALAEDANLHALADTLTPKLCETLGSSTQYALQVFVPDSTVGNPLAQRAQALHDLLSLRLQRALPAAERVLDIEQHRQPLPMLQVCLFVPTSAAVGVITSDRALARAVGGRTRMRLSGDFPSRAARKLEEALSWLGMAPGPGELCVDLGAAPGGWSWVLLERRARVIAIDPARMDEKLQNDRRLRHIKGDAFKYTPEEPVDWLFCDMVWKPIEVARMLGRWGRQRSTRMLVSNFKLPMKRKVEMVHDIRTTLAEAGFTAIRTRQLYHDREEITLTARVR